MIIDHHNNKLISLWAEAEPAYSAADKGWLWEAAAVPPGWGGIHAHSSEGGRRAEESQNEGEARQANRGDYISDWNH